MAFRLLIIFLISGLSLSNVKCFSHRSMSNVKTTILFEMTNDILLTKCRQTGMAALLDENIVEFLSDCDVPRPEDGNIKTIEQADGYLCLAYYDVNLKLCKYFTIDNDTKIALPKTKDDFKEVLKTLGNLTEYCSVGHTAIQPTDFEQTRSAIKPLIAFLSDEKHCRKACYDMDDDLKPICKILLWANKKLSDYDESRKGHETIMKLKGNLAQAIPPKVNTPPKIENVTVPLQTSHEKVNVILPTIIPTVMKPVEPAVPPKKSTPVTVSDPHVYSQTSVHNGEELPSSVVEVSASAVEIPKEIVTAKPPVTIGNVQPKLPQESMEKQPQPVLQSPKVTVDQNKIFLDKQTSDEMGSNVNGMQDGYLKPVRNGMEPDDMGNNGENMSPDDDFSNAKDLRAQLQSSNRDPPEAYEGLDDPDQIVENPQAISSSSAVGKGRFNSATSVNQADSGYTFTGHSVEAEDSHFFPFFFLCLGFVMFGYVLFHNKHKVLGLLVEGRRGEGRRRGVGGPAYRKLDCTLEEAVNSAPPSHNPHIVY